MFSYILMTEAAAVCCGIFTKTVNKTFKTSKDQVSNYLFALCVYPVATKGNKCGKKISNKKKRGKKSSLVYA